MIKLSQEISLGLVSDGWIRNKLLCWLEKWQRKDILWVYEIATLCHAEIDMELVTCLVCGVLLSELHLLCMLLCLKIMKDVVCCCLFCGVPTHQYLLTRLETIIYLTEVYCQLCCRTVFLEPNFKAAWIWVVRAGWEGMLALPLFSLTLLVVWLPFFFCWLTCPGMLFTKLNCFPFSSHFYLTIILCFCFFV